MKTPMTAMFTPSALPDTMPATNESPLLSAFTTILSGRIEILKAESAGGANKPGSEVQQPDPAMATPWVLATMGGLPVIPIMDKTGELSASAPNRAPLSSSASYPISRHLDNGLTSLSTPQVELAEPSAAQALHSPALASAVEPQASIPVKSRQLDTSLPAMPEAQLTTPASPFPHPASATASLQPSGTREETNASISATKRLALEEAFSVAAQLKPIQPANSKPRSLSADLASVTQLPTSTPASLPTQLAVTKTDNLPSSAVQEPSVAISATKRLALEDVLSVAAQPKPIQPADSEPGRLGTDSASVTQLPATKPEKPLLDFRSMPQAEDPVVSAESYSAARATLRLNAGPQSRQSANSAVENVQTKTLGNLLASSEQPLLMEPAHPDRQLEHFLTISTATASASRNPTSPETSGTQPTTTIPLGLTTHQRSTTHAGLNAMSADHFTAILTTLQQSSDPISQHSVSPRGLADEKALEPAAAPATPGGGDSVTFPALPSMAGAIGSSAPLTPGQPHLATPVHHLAWAQELNQTVTRMAVQDLQRAELHLNPTQLGPLDVVIEVKGDQATALFSSPHAVVRDAVEQALPRLREMMAQNGIALGNATVSDQGTRHSREGFSRKPSSGSTSSDKISANMSGVAGQPVLPQAMVHRHTGLLDTFA